MVYRRVTLDIDEPNKYKVKPYILILKMLGWKVWETKKGFHAITVMDIQGQDDEEVEINLKKIRKDLGDDPKRIEYNHDTLWQKKKVYDMKGKVIYSSIEKEV